MKHDRSHYIKVGKVIVNPENALAMKIAQAGAQAAQSHEPPKTVRENFDAVNAANRRRARRAAKARLEKPAHSCYICARAVPIGTTLCSHCRKNKDLSEGREHEGNSGTDSSGLPRSE